jgi:hypothetical protein
MPTSRSDNDDELAELITQVLVSVIEAAPCSTTGASKGF